MDVSVPSLYVVMEFAYQLFMAAFIAFVFSVFIATLLSGSADTGDLAMLNRSKASDKSRKKREQRAGVVEDGRFSDLFPVQGFGRKTKRVKFVDDSSRAFHFKSEELMEKNIETLGSELSESRDDGRLVPTCKVMETDVNLGEFSFPEKAVEGEEVNAMLLVGKDKVGWLEESLLEERAVKQGIACEIEGFNNGKSGGIGLKDLSKEERRENVEAEAGIVAEEEIEREESTEDREGSRDVDGLELGTVNDVAYLDKQGRIIETLESELKERSEEREVGIGADLGSQEKEIRVVGIEEIERKGRILFREADDDCIELDTANDVVDHYKEVRIVEYVESELKETGEDRGIDEIGSEAEGAALNLAIGIVVDKTQAIIGGREEIERVKGIGDRERDDDGLQLGTANDAVDHDQQGRSMEFEKSECKKESEDRGVDEICSESVKKEVQIVGIEENEQKEKKYNREVSECMELAKDSEFVYETRQGTILESRQVESKGRTLYKGSHEDGTGDVSKGIRVMPFEENVASGNEEWEIGEKNDGRGVISDDEEWEGIERTELEKTFAKATNFVEYGDKEGHLAKVGSDVIIQLHGLQKVAIQGPCYEPQPMALMLSARAKWNAWKRLGSISPEEAMEQYITLLSHKVPGWMEDNSSVEEKLNSSMTGMQNHPNAGLSTALTEELMSEHERKLEVEPVMMAGGVSDGSIQ